VPKVTDMPAIVAPPAIRLPRHPPAGTVPPVRRLIHLVVVGALTAGLTGCGGPARPTGSWAPMPTPTSLPAPATSAPPGPRTITILGSGDVLLHPPLWPQARDGFRALFEGVRDPIQRADLAICHLETPLAPAAGPYHGYPLFSVPPRIAPALADLGYDSCSTASNHTLDQGEAGVRRTLEDLDKADLAHAGSYRSKADHDTVTQVDVHGVTVAHLSYTFGFNGLSRPAGREWIANLIDPNAIEAEARRARAAGADIVVVSLHWGTEYAHAPTSDQIALARRLLASPDIDLILGCHAHVVQPFEKIGSKWVVYSMGNEVAHHAEPVNANREGVLARFTFTEQTSGRWRATRAEAIPVWMDLAGSGGRSADRLVDLSAELADPSVTGARRDTYRAALRRIEGYLESRGAGDDGLIVAGTRR